jgi:hypothetical protein
MRLELGNMGRKHSGYMFSEVLECQSPKLNWYTKISGCSDEKSNGIPIFLESIRLFKSHMDSSDFDIFSQLSQQNWAFSHLILPRKK